MGLAALSPAGDLMKHLSPGFRWRRLRKRFISCRKVLPLLIFSDARLSPHSKKVSIDLGIRLATTPKAGSQNLGLKINSTAFSSKPPETVRTLKVTQGKTPKQWGR